MNKINDNKTGTSPWRLLDTGPGRGSFNMALDEALFLLALEGKSPPTIRFYAWSPPAVSLGYAQRWEGEVDPARCRERGIDLVRRPTGGRAVLHDDEVTYSVVWGGARAGEADPFGEGVLPVYLRVGTALAEGLKGLGLEASLAPPLRKAWGGGGHHPVCFSSASGYEITCGGHKVVGSALKKQGSAFLQHGSILLGGHGERLSELLGDRYRGTAPEAARIGLRDLTGGRAGYRSVVSSLAAGFPRAWETEIVPGEPNAEELTLAEQLEREKYRGNWRRAHEEDADR